MHPDEAQLLWRLWRGETQAFAELVDQYSEMVLNLAARMTGSRETGEDIAQEVFVRVWKALPSFRGECKLSTWIYRITVNLCIAESKTARGRSSYISLDDPVLLHQPQVSAGTNNPYAEEVILKERLGPMIAQMPDYYRTALTLYYLKDLSYQEIADIMNVPIGTVKSYLYRGKVWLRNRMLGQDIAREDIP